MSNTAAKTLECDILMPVYNGLTYVTDAVDAVLEHTHGFAYRLTVIDDASDKETATWLEQRAADDPRMRVIRSAENQGFVHACRRGYEASQTPFVLLLNSDVVVTPGWLQRLIQCARSDPKIASVNPLTNHASQLVMPMLPGASYLAMNALLNKRPPQYPDVVTGVGFCMLLRRSALERVGFFDEIFGRGYCEDSDLSMRLTTHGYRTVVADDVYIYHRGSGTFGAERGPRYLANRRIFDQRWSKEYRRQFANFAAADPLREVRTLIRYKTRWNPMPVVWETGRKTRTALQERKPLSAAKELIKGALLLPQSRRLLVQPADVDQVTRKGRLRITYILHRLVVAGGVLSVIQIVNQLILLGVEARIVTLFEDHAVYRWTKLYTKPIVYANERELLSAFPETDVVVATLWTTAPWTQVLVDRGRATVGVYFLQDYEPWFFPADDKTASERVRSTFEMLPNRIVKSDWLAAMLAADGYDTHKISIGMDLANFYPRDTKPGPITVVAMARPLTPRRGFAATIEALAIVKKARPDIEIRLFGDSALHRHEIPFEYRDEGVVADQERMARIYSSADVFLDGSEFQGFGRCGLEAMACGAACVLTNVGGVNEYARHEENALLVVPNRPGAFADAVVRLIDDAQTRSALVAAGRQTVERFCHRREARETLEYFRSLLPELAVQ